MGDMAGCNTLGLKMKGGKHFVTEWAVRGEITSAQLFTHIVSSLNGVCVCVRLAGHSATSFQCPPHQDTDTLILGRHIMTVHRQSGASLKYDEADSKRRGQNIRSVNTGAVVSPRLAAHSHCNYVSRSITFSFTLSHVCICSLVSLAPPPPNPLLFFMRSLPVFSLAALADSGLGGILASTAPPPPPLPPTPCLRLPSPSLTLRTHTRTPLHYSPSLPSSRSRHPCLCAHAARAGGSRTCNRLRLQPAPTQIK